MKSFLYFLTVLFIISSCTKEIINISDVKESSSEEYIIENLNSFETDDFEELIIQNTREEMYFENGLWYYNGLIIYIDPELVEPLDPIDIIPSELNYGEKYMKGESGITEGGNFWIRCWDNGKVCGKTYDSETGVYRGLYIDDPQ